MKVANTERLEILGSKAVCIWKNHKSMETAESSMVPESIISGVGWEDTECFKIQKLCGMLLWW